MECFPRAVAALLMLCSLRAALASEGDRSPFYQNCVRICTVTNCSLDGQLFKNAADDGWLDRLTLWECSDECRYNCMWRTVNSFRDREWDVPKFHGKWPFVRVLGMQELGSVIGSILNLAAHLLMYNKLKVLFSTRNTPLIWLWHVFAVVCIHAWIWSIIFHVRDTPFTEFMDYACAMSMLMILYVSCVLRLAYGKSKLIGVLVTSMSLIYYVEHVRYLYTGQIDYEYNMMANIVPGALAVVLWTMWGCWRCRRFPYTWRILLFNALTVLFMTLELLDFPPYMYVWDAHALWHMSTSILPLIFYRFLIDDLVYLRQSWPENVEKPAIKIF